MAGRTGLLAPHFDISAPLRELLVDSARRRDLGAAAARFVSAERSMDAAAKRLGELLRPL
jgi:hypothetical protein